MTGKQDWMRNTGRRNVSFTPKSEVYETFKRIVEGFHGKPQITEGFTRIVLLLDLMLRLVRQGWTFQAESPEGRVVVFDFGLEQQSTSEAPNETPDSEP